MGIFQICMDRISNLYGPDIQNRMNLHEILYAEGQFKSTGRKKKVKLKCENFRHYDILIEKLVISKVCTSIETNIVSYNGSQLTFINFQKICT